jgi:hypothetical protein
MVRGVKKFMKRWSRKVFRNLFFTHDTPEYLKDMTAHHKISPQKQERYEATYGHKNVSTYKPLPYTNAGA